MKLKIKYKCFFIFLFFLFFSCSELNNIEIVDIKNINLENFNLNERIASIYLNVLINNPSNYKVKIKDLQLKIIIDNRYVGKLLLEKSLVIFPKTQDWYNISFQLKLMDVLSILSIYSEFIEGKDIKISLQGSLIGKSYVFVIKEPIIKEFVINIKNKNFVPLDKSNEK